MGEVQRGSKLVKRCVRGFQALGSLIALLSATSAHAATITVSSSCSLVDAIKAANTDAPSSGCSAGSGADTIKLPFHSSIVISSVDNTDFDGGLGPTPAGLPLIESTITGNTGYGIRNDGFYVAEISHSIISGNHAGEVLGYTSPYFSSVIADDYNIFGHNGVSGTNFPVGATDIVPSGSVPSIFDPLLGLHGGATPNLALVSGSPAINAIPSSEPCPNVDQRELPRPGNLFCDIGAFEAQ
jgi:hypothetical protein